MKVMFKEGQMVHKGDLLLEIDVRPYQVELEQAEGQLIHDQALLKNAHVDLDRYKVLLKQQAIPEQQLATQEALVTQYEGTIKTDQAPIDSAKLNLVYCHITSPITGVVGLRLVDPGNIVHATDTNGLVVITQIDPISVIFTIAEDQLPPVLAKMHAGQQLPVEAWDRENKNKLARRHAGDHRQPDRPDHRHAEAARCFRQHERQAVPQPVRERAAAGGTESRT